MPPGSTPGRWPSLLLPALLLSIAGPLAAQVPGDSTTADALPVESLDTLVVTGTRIPAALGGASAVVVIPESLHIAPAASLEQALRELPFVLVRQNSRGETELSLRGSESRQMAVMLDGVPLSLGWDHRTDPSLVPLTGAQRLVLVRGLSSLLHGPNVLGGIVEVDLGRAAPGTTPSRSLSVGMGVDANGARRLSAAGSAPLQAGSGTLALRGGVGYRTRDGVSLSGDVVDPAAAGGLRTNSDLEQVDGFAAARWQHESGRYVGLTATGYHAERGVPPELHVGSPRLWRYPSIWRGLGILTAGTGPVTTPLGLGALDLAAGLNLGSTEIERFDDPAYRTITGRERGEERSLSARLHGRHSLPAGGELRAAVTGAEVRFDEYLDEAAPNRYRQRLWSTALETQWPIPGDVLVGGGVVYDAASTPETGGKPALDGLSAWGWRLGATMPALADALRLHASASGRARFPALRELYSDAVARFEPNPDLRPERLLGAEVGATLVRALTGGSALNLQTVVFHHRLADAIVREATGDGRFRRVNRHALRSTGVELLAGWSAPSGWSLTGDLLLQRIREDDPEGEQQPEHQPEVRGRFGVTVPLPLGLRLLSDLRYVGRQYCVHPDLTTTVALAGQGEGDVGLERAWALRDAGGAGRLLSALRATVSVDNVTDATVYDQCGLPRPGRTLRVAMQLR
ncbi:MAG: TonB-dependent receptor plug domain-containing protein [Gemmatimonadales bacterium]